MENLSTGIALSLHLGLPGEFNPVHPYIEYEKNSFITGGYFNSYGEVSLYAGRRTYITEDLSFDSGIATYDKELEPMLRLKYKDYFVMPAENKGEVGVVVGIQKQF